MRLVNWLNWSVTYLVTKSINCLIRQVDISFHLNVMTDNAHCSSQFRSLFA
jgi:hypothetical protein